MYVVAGLLWFPGSVILAMSTQEQLPGISGFLLFFGIGAAAYYAAGTMLVRWRCPRCGRYFSARSPARAIPLKRQCQHCGLGIGADWRETVSDASPVSV